MAAPHRDSARFPLVLLLALLTGACSEDSPTKPKVASGPTDTTTPMIVVSSPARSAMLLEGTLADGAVSISGTACDSTDGISGVNVLGNPVPVSGTPTCAPFNVDQTSRWGLSIVTADATSAGGAKETLVQSYLRSPEYFGSAASPSASTRAPAATVTRLDQDVLDDNNRNDADDLATILELALNGQNWSALTPTVIVASPDANGNGVVDTRTYDCLLYTETNTATGYLVRRTGNFARGPVRVDYIQATAGHVGGQISVTNLNLPLSVTGYLDLLCAGEQAATVSGNVLADKAVLTTLQHITVNSQGQFISNAPTVTIAFTNLRLAIDWGPLSFISGLLDSITNAILDLFEGSLEGMAGDILAGVVPEILSSLALPSQVTLPAPTGTVVGVSGVFDAFTEGNGWVQIGIAAQFYPQNPVFGRAALSHGAIRKNGAAPALGASGSGIEAGIKDDAINQFLWAAWAGGAFDLGPQAGGPCLSGLPAGISSIRANLPPVIMPGRNGHTMDLGLGDLLVETASASFYVSGIAGIDISIDSVTQKLMATLDANPEIHVQIASSTSSTDPATLLAGVETAVRCLFEERVSAVFGAFPIPEFNLGGLNIPGIPAGAKLKIAGATIERAGDYAVLRGDLVSP